MTTNDPDPTADTTARIAGITRLTRAQAVAALTLALDRQHLLPDPTQLHQLDTRTRQAAQEAAHQPHRDLDTLPAGTAPTLQATATGAVGSPGELARDTLAHLATTRPDLTATIDQAITLAISDHAADSLSAERLDPATLAIGALVLLALQTDVKLERGTTGGWRFAVHKKALSDASITKIITKLIATYTTSGK